MDAGQFAARGIHVGAVHNTRLYELDTPAVATREEAVAQGRTALMSHPFANRLHIVQGVRDSYNNTVYAEIVEEIDVAR